MFLSANLPFTMEFESTGSVGVTHDPTAKACRNGRFGTIAQTSRLVTIHIAHITGPRSKDRLFHSVFRYLLGN